MDVFTLIALFILTLAWWTVKGVLLVVATFFIVKGLTKMINATWDMIHPKSLIWLKKKFRKKVDKNA
jgi:hypothetical protein